MVSPFSLLILNLVHIVVGTIGLSFLLVVLSSIQESINTNASSLITERNYIAVAAGLAIVAWTISVVTHPMEAPALHDGALYDARVIAGFSLVSLVLYALAGSFAAVAYTNYPETLLVSASFLLLVASLITLIFGACGIVLSRPPIKYYI